MSRRKRAPNGAPLAFLREVISSEISEACVLWPFGTSTEGYPVIRQGAKVRYVQRIVLEEVSGPAPNPDSHACHQPLVCHNPLCISPAHLRWGTAQDNANDRILDGTVPKGEAHPRAKLTEKDVREIRRLQGEMRSGEIARLFGIQGPTVRNIQAGRRWRHIE